MTYRFWYEQGAKRVVSARELSLAEIREIREHIPDDLEIETFVPLEVLSGRGKPAGRIYADRRKRPGNVFV